MVGFGIVRYHGLVRHNAECVFLLYKLLSLCTLLSVGSVISADEYPAQQVRDQSKAYPLPQLC